MPTLSEIMASPEALERAAEEFVNFHCSRTKSQDGMNQGIQTDAEFIKLMDNCGKNDAIDYKKFCEIGKDD